MVAIFSGGLLYVLDNLDALWELRTTVTYPDFIQLNELMSLEWDRQTLKQTVLLYMHKTLVSLLTHPIKHPQDPSVYTDLHYSHLNYMFVSPKLESFGS